MPSLQLFQNPRQQMLACAAVLIMAATLFGGASRLDLVAPVVVRLVAIGLLVWIGWTAIAPLKSAGRYVWTFWAALLALPLIQLIPLPWSLWTMLPGRELAADIYQSIGQTPWQPISLTPERTLNGLFALIPAFAAFMIGIRLDDAGRDKLLLLICLLAISSALIGLLQIVGGEGSPLYFYAVTNSDASVGWFSNANHHSLFLCTGVALIFYWLAGQFGRGGVWPWGKLWFAAVGLLCLFLSLPATASRAGLLLSGVAVLGGLTLLPREKMGISNKIFWGRAIPALLIIGLGIGYLAFRQVFGDAGAAGLLEDGRVNNVGDFVTIAANYFPFGSGLGSFDPVYRIFEDVESIQLNYLNNAHNEPAQILIEAGLPGLLLIAAFLFWWGRSAWHIWRSAGYDGRQTRQLRVATIIMAMLILHSLVDYPMRTASLSVLFAFCAAFMAVRPAAATGRSRGLALSEYIDQQGESDFAFSTRGQRHMTHN